MRKYMYCFAVIGAMISINSAHARSGAASCPQVMSIPALKEIVKTKLNSNVNWAGTTWTLVRTPFPSGLPANVTITQLWGARNNNGTLECYYQFDGVSGLLGLTTSYLGPI